MPALTLNKGPMLRADSAFSGHQGWVINKKGEVKQMRPR